MKPSIYVDRFALWERVCMWLACIAAVLFTIPTITIAMNPITPCPDTPNCVSSLSTNAKRFIEPIRYRGERSQARARLEKTVQTLERATVTQSEEALLEVEFRSRGLGFVDKVTFYLPPTEGVIHVKSASQSGYFDFGVNRKRVEKIRRLFGEPPQKTR